MIKAILIDLDNTLYEYVPCNNEGNESLIKETARLLGISQEDAKEKFLLARQLVKEGLGNVASSHSRLLYIQKMIELLTGRTNIELTIKLHDIFWNSYLSKMKIEDSVKKFLIEVKKAGLKIVIVTDLTTEIQLHKIVKLGISDMVDAVITSEEAGAEKPDPKIFELAMKKIGCSPQECLFLGDDNHKDVNGSALIGMQSIHIKHTSDLTFSILDNLK